MLYNKAFWWQIILTLGHSISETKCDRDKLIFFCWKRLSIWSCWGINKIGIQSDWKSPKQGSSPRNVPTMPKYGSTLPRSSSQPTCTCGLNNTISNRCIPYHQYPTPTWHRRRTYEQDLKIIHQFTAKYIHIKLQLQSRCLYFLTKPT